MGYVMHEWELGEGIGLDRVLVEQWTEKQSHQDLRGLDARSDKR